MQISAKESLGYYELKNDAQNTRLKKTGHATIT
jgi:hypothetical protein